LPLTIEESAHLVKPPLDRQCDGGRSSAVIRALGFKKVDLLGFSLGGFVAQDIALKTPELVRETFLTGTGPASGQGIDKVWPVSWPMMLKELVTLRDPKFYLVLTGTADGQKAARIFRSTEET